MTNWYDSEGWPSVDHPICGVNGINARISQLEWELVSRYQGSRWRKHLVKVLEAKANKLQVIIERS